ncbi:hypothetical protein B7R22_14415 [Subtercola boreus]|uniref:Uncharacterized protein n=1 Tax=Subtercola boreus TaxID=120213 RepID=A0A3E0VS66_9MICO|nr:hypothetical protein [Subtercola boreus]RFA12842.1 hypothetical protein B7R22_14415 [Subtercola boreus]
MLETPKTLQTLDIMGRGGRKRWLSVDDAYWKLIHTIIQTDAELQVVLLDVAGLCLVDASCASRCPSMID